MLTAILIQEIENNPDDSNSHSYINVSANVDYYFLKDFYELELGEVLYKASNTNIWIHIIVKSSSLHRYITTIKAIINKYAHEKAKIFVTIDNYDRVQTQTPELSVDNLIEYVDFPYIYDVKSMEIIRTNNASYEENVDVVFVVILWSTYDGGFTQPEMRQIVENLSTGNDIIIGSATAADNVTYSFFTEALLLNLNDRLMSIQSDFLLLFMNNIHKHTKDLYTAWSSTISLHANIHVFSTRPKTKVSRVFDEHMAYVGSNPIHEYIPLFFERSTYNTAHNGFILNLNVNHSAETGTKNDSFVMDLDFTGKDTKHTLSSITNVHMFVSFDPHADDLVVGTDIQYHVVDDCKLVVYCEKITSTAAGSIQLAIKLSVPKTEVIIDTDHTYYNILSVSCAGNRITSISDIMIKNISGAPINGIVKYMYYEQTLEWFHHSFVDLSIYGKIETTTTPFIAGNYVVYYLFKNSQNEIILKKQSITTDRRFEIILPQGSYTTCVELVNTTQTSSFLSNDTRLVLYGAHNSSGIVFDSADIITSPEGPIYDLFQLGEPMNMYNRYSSVPRYMYKDREDGVQINMFTELGSALDVYVDVTTGWSGTIAYITLSESNNYSYMLRLYGSSGTQAITSITCESNNTKSIFVDVWEDGNFTNCSIYVKLDPYMGKTTSDDVYLSINYSYVQHLYYGVNGGRVYAIPQNSIAPNATKKQRRYRNAPINGWTNNMLEYNYGGSIKRVVIEEPVYTSNQLIDAIISSAGSDFIKNSGYLRAHSGVTIELLFQKDNEHEYRDRSIAPLLGKPPENVYISYTSQTVSVLNEQIGWFRYRTKYHKTSSSSSGGTDKILQMYVTMDTNIVGTSQILDWRKHYWKPSVSPQHKYIKIRTNVLQDETTIKVHYYITIKSELNSDTYEIDLGCIHHFDDSSVHVYSDELELYENFYTEKEAYDHLELAASSNTLTVANTTSFYRSTLSDKAEIVNYYNSATGLFNNFLIIENTRSVYDGKLCLAYVGDSGDRIVVFTNDTSANIIVSSRIYSAQIGLFIDIDIPHIESGRVYVVGVIKSSSSAPNIYYMQPDYDNFKITNTPSFVTSASTNVYNMSINQLYNNDNVFTYNSTIDLSQYISYDLRWNHKYDLINDSYKIGVPYNTIILSAYSSISTSKDVHYLFEDLVSIGRNRFLLYRYTFLTNPDSARQFIIKLKNGVTHNVDFSVNPLDFEPNKFNVFAYKEVDSNDQTLKVNIRAEIIAVGSSTIICQFNLWLYVMQWDTKNIDSYRYVSIELLGDDNAVASSPSVIFVGSSMERH